MKVVIFILKQDYNEVYHLMNLMWGILAKVLKSILSHFLALRVSFLINIIGRLPGK